MATLTVQQFSQGDQLVHLDELNPAIKQWLDMLKHSENALVQDGRETLEVFQRFKVEVGDRFALLSTENRQLREQLEKTQSRQREIEVLHQAEIATLKAQLAASDKTAETLRNEMAVTASKADERVAAALAAQELAVDVAIQAGDARVEATRAERDAEWDALIAKRDAEDNAEWRALIAKRDAEWRALIAERDAEWQTTVDAATAQRDAEWEAVRAADCRTTAANTRAEYAEKYRLIPKPAPKLIPKRR